MLEGIFGEVTWDKVVLEKLLPHGVAECVGVSN